ncbi:MAG TPA: PilZ domain-containing protein [Acidobacteriota bacterium]|nr:PilZ domain-containing protein [Acidobacteriota bacterium]
MRQQRQEHRSLCADLVQVGWKLEDESKHTEWATLEDISSRGACVKLDEPIPPGTLVSLRFPKGGCVARIKYCVADHTGGHLLGVLFENGYRWSRTKYKPEHLVQFRLRPVSRK